MLQRALEEHLKHRSGENGLMVWSECDILRADNKSELFDFLSLCVWLWPCLYVYNQKFT